MSQSYCLMTIESNGMTSTFKYCRTSKFKSKSNASFIGTKNLLEMTQTARSMQGARGQVDVYFHGALFALFKERNVKFELD